VAPTWGGDGEEMRLTNWEGGGWIVATLRRELFFRAQVDVLVMGVGVEFDLDVDLTLTLHRVEVARRPMEFCGRNTSPNVARTPATPVLRAVR
jgi:hypothetical protein